MQTKLQVLENYLNYVIEHEEEHNWANCSKCHCGMLLRSVNLEPLIKSSYNYDFMLNTDSWYKLVFELYKNNNCTITNKKFDMVVSTLLNYGFTLQELIDLEHLEDKRFLNVDTSKRKYYSSVDNLIQYLTNWINYEKQLVKAVNTETVTIQVGV